MRIITSAVLSLALYLALNWNHPAVAQTSQTEPALDTYSMSHDTAIDQSQEKAFVKSVADEVLAAIRTGQSLDKVKSDLEEIFNRTIDIDWVGRFVLGRSWKNANPDQKQRFAASYRKFMINSYADKLKEYSGEKYTLSDAKALDDSKHVVTMTLYRSGGKPVLIDYKIRSADNTLKIYDLVVEGISLISTQRSEFNSVINRKGLDYLIAALDKKTAAQ